jgi:hypothetical protein
VLERPAEHQFVDLTEQLTREGGAAAQPDVGTGLGFEPAGQGEAWVDLAIVRRDPERRAALLDAAIDVLATDGARRLTSRAVDQHAGVPAGISTPSPPSLATSRD